MLAKASDRIAPHELKVEIGDQVHFGCHLEKEIKWFHELIKYQPQTYPFAVGNRYLSIESVQLNNSGNYFCYGVHPKTETAVVSKSQLIVYGKQCFFVVFFWLHLLHFEYFLNLE